LFNRLCYSFLRVYTITKTDEPICNVWPLKEMWKDILWNYWRTKTCFHKIWGTKVWCY